jgi:dihydrofolate synthase/folylpolyglutamate synthase
LIAGTNGKGSVGAMLQAMLSASGVEPGLFTSPHLVRPNERIRLGDRDIGDHELARRLSGMRQRIETAVERGALETPPSFFEVITATALEAFGEVGVGVAVLEVGLGGRLDATNAVDADVSVIVSIDLDHTKTLGPTLEQIAAEKGGIVRSGRPVVSGVVRQRATGVLQQICRERGAPWIDANAEVRLVGEDGERITLRSRRHLYRDLHLALAGRHQIHNARVAIATLECVAERAGFDVEPDAVREGLRNVRWPGRLQWIPGDGNEPNLLLDGAHNPAGAKALARHLDTLARPAPLVLLGVMRGKLLDEMIGTLAPRIHGVVIACPSVRRAADPDEVAALVRKYVDRVEVVPDTAAALDRAKSLAGTERDVLVTGSLYLVGEVLSLLTPHPTPGPVST